MCGFRACVEGLEEGGVARWHWVGASSVQEGSSLGGGLGDLCWSPSKSMREVGRRLSDACLLQLLRSRVPELWLTWDGTDVSVFKVWELKRVGEVCNRFRCCVTSSFKFQDSNENAWQSNSKFDFEIFDRVILIILDGLRARYSSLCLI